MPVNTKELINQMNEVANRLDQHESGGDLADLIQTWITCVEELQDMIATNETEGTADSLDAALQKAVSASKGFNPRLG